MNSRSPQDHLTSWLEELSQYNMEIRHRNADDLSRIPASGCPNIYFVVRPSDIVTDAPKCLKAHQAWGTFAKKVDDVVPLAPSGSWAYSPPDGETTSTEPVVCLAATFLEPSQPTPVLTVSETAFGYVSGALLGSIGLEPLPELDLEDNPVGERPFRT
jgi:hypothetical protein